MTAALVPLTAFCRSAKDVTVTGVALPPPVVVVTPLPDIAAQPTSGLGSGGAVQLPVVPAVAVAPPRPVAPPVSEVPVLVRPPVAALPPAPVRPPVAAPPPA